MKFTFFAPERGSLVPVALETDEMPRFRIRKDREPIVLKLMHKGKSYTLASSYELQRWYLFLEPEWVEDLYKEVVERIHKQISEEERADIDLILAEVMERHAPELMEKAGWVNLQVVNNDVFFREAKRYFMATLRKKAVSLRYEEEKNMLKRLIQKASARKRTPEDVIMGAMVSLAYSRMIRARPGMRRSLKSFRKLMRSFLEQGDMQALIQYCSRPECERNAYLETVLKILVFNCPDYPTAWVPL